MQDFRKLDVWTRSLRLATVVYELTSSFPRSETFGLVAQIRRSAVSMPSNIAEGCGRNGPKEFRRFIRIAMGSACELETQLVIARDVGFGEPTDLTDSILKCEEIRQMLTGLERRLTP